MRYQTCEIARSVGRKEGAVVGAPARAFRGRAPLSAAEKSPPAVLSLDDDGFAAGDLAASDRAGCRALAGGGLCRRRSNSSSAGSTPFTGRRPRSRSSPRASSASSSAAATWSSARSPSLDATEAQLELPRIGRLHVRAIGDPPDLPLARECRSDLSGPQRALRLARFHRRAEQRTRSGA